MTRHGKNCTAGAVYTYHEKKKDTAASGYGTQSIRLGKDAIKDFDCCCLSLQPCQDPVVTPDGYLYDKQAILEYILHQKTEIAKKLKAYEKQKQAQKSNSQLESKSEEREKVERFKTRENSIVSKPINPFTSAQNKGSEKSRTDSSAESSSASSSQSLPSFWIPSLTPEAKPTLLKKPLSAARLTTCDALGRVRGSRQHPLLVEDSNCRTRRALMSEAPKQKSLDLSLVAFDKKVARFREKVIKLSTLTRRQSKAVLCPMSGRPIKMNELITVHFSPLDASLDRVALLTRQDRYVCAVTRDALGNSVPCAVLRPSGAVVTQECVEKLIKKDMIDPVTGDKLSDRDIIPLQRGGTGFAASGVDLRAKEARPVMQA